MQLGKFWDNTAQNWSRKILDMFWHCRTNHVFKTRYGSSYSWYGSSYSWLEL